MATFADAYRTNILVTILLYFKFLVTYIRWAPYKGLAGQRPAEDGDLNNKNAGEEQRLAAEHAGRLVTNDQENLPYGLIFIWASILCIQVAAGVEKDLDAVLDAHMAFTIAF